MLSGEDLSEPSDERLPVKRFGQELYGACSHGLAHGFSALQAARRHDRNVGSASIGAKALGQLPSRHAGKYKVKDDRFGLEQQRFLQSFRGVACVRDTEAASLTKFAANFAQRSIVVNKQN